jgi:hypothetical protein
MAFAVEVDLGGENDGAVSLDDRLARQAGCNFLMKGDAPDAGSDLHGMVECDAHGSGLLVCAWDEWTY